MTKSRKKMIKVNSSKKKVYLSTSNDLKKNQKYQKASKKNFR